MGFLSSYLAASFTCMSTRITTFLLTQGLTGTEYYFHVRTLAFFSLLSYLVSTILLFWAVWDIFVYSYRLQLSVQVSPVYVRLCLLQRIKSSGCKKRRHATS